jgi:hypothetical protein
MTGLATVVHAAALDEVGCHNREKPNGFVPSPRQRVAGSAVDLTLAISRLRELFCANGKSKTALQSYICRYSISSDIRKRARSQANTRCQNRE